MGRTALSVVVVTVATAWLASEVHAGWGSWGASYGSYGSAGGSWGSNGSWGGSVGYASGGSWGGTTLPRRRPYAWPLGRPSGLQTG